MEVKEENLLTPIKALKQLERKVDLTRRARIKASQRLRQKNDFFEKVAHFYSLLVLGFSIWFILTPNDVVNLNATKILLIVSLSLTFFTMFLGVKNYKERANNFESNYQQLNVLLHKIHRLEINPAEIYPEKLKELHREYEKLLIGKENHHNIDYMACNSEMANKFKYEIWKFRIMDNIIKLLIAVYPVVLIILIILVGNIINKFAF